MAAHNELGRIGELLGLCWLLGQKFEIIYTNWKHAKVEVDIIAKKSSILHFIEIKSRSNNNFGFPEESVSEKKIQNIKIAAEEFLFQFPEWKRIQFDVLSITISNRRNVEFFFIEDIY